MRNRINALIFFLFLCGALFGAAGRFDWPMAWAFVAIMIVFSITGFLVLPAALIEERSRWHTDTRLEDLALAGPAGLLLYPVTLIVCGVDFRRAWSPPIPAPTQWAAFAVFVVGYAFSMWAARSNPFFSTVVRIQRERGHTVIDRGPYRLVRHPGYAGPVFSHLALPLMLGSVWGLLPAVLGCAFLMARAVYEEQTLAEDLPGYREYMQRVRWRLLPGVW